MSATYDSYETLLDSDLSLAWREGGMHFENDSEVHKTLERIARRLDELGIDYAIVGAMAMFFHGHRRFTHDVNLLVTREGLAQIHEKSKHLGYVPIFAGSEALRDAINRVNVDFIVAGDYPGGGKPGPVAFPQPTEASIEIDGLKLIKLENLVELKLASGQAPHRIQDTADVQNMIANLDLPEELKEQIDPSLRDEYAKLWAFAQQTKQDDYYPMSPDASFSAPSPR